MTDEKIVRDGFWQKTRQTLGRVPFTEDAVAAFHCATDSTTPLPIRVTLFGALAYFVMPFDVIPDFILGLGYTDDPAVLFAAYKAASAHITEAHREKARLAAQGTAAAGGVAAAAARRSRASVASR